MTITVQREGYRPELHTDRSVRDLLGAIRRASRADGRVYWLSVEGGRRLLVCAGLVRVVPPRRPAGSMVS